MNGMTDTEFMTSEEKYMVLRQWQIFLKKLREVDYLLVVGADYGQFPISLDKPFTERLYKYLSLHEGFIAHFNRRGFISARFGTAADTAETLRLMKDGFCGSGYRDIHNAMIEALNNNAGQAMLNEV